MEGNSWALLWPEGKGAAASWETRVAHVAPPLSIGGAPRWWCAFKFSPVSESWGVGVQVREVWVWRASDVEFGKAHGGQEWQRRVGVGRGSPS